MTDRAFNDAVLRENEMPIVFLRAIFNQEPLNWLPRWRFLDEISYPDKH